MSKSADAFRTISEVAEWLGVQTHVLRFWESKFTQIKPVKRAGGRRYYRPADMLLLGGIRKLLHDDGMTIKGVQKLLREEGMAYVADMSAPLDDETAAQIDGDCAPDAGFVEAETAPEPTADTVTPFVPIARPEPEEVAKEPAPTVPDPAPTKKPSVAHSAPEPEPVASPQPADASAVKKDTNAPEQTVSASAPPDPAPLAEDPVAALPDPVKKEPPEAPRPRFARTPDPAPPISSSGLVNENEDTVATPSFLTGRKQGPTETTPQNAAPSVEPPAPEPPKPKPRIVDVPDEPDPASIEVAPSALSKAARLTHLRPEQSDAIRPLLAQLTALRDQMASASGDRR